MFRSRFAVAAAAALYFAALASLAFVIAPGSNGRFWIWTTVAFIPVGIFLVGMFGRRRWWAALAFSIVAAAWLEAAQTVWMPAGYADVVDILLAAIGSGIGVSIAVSIAVVREHAQQQNAAYAQPSRNLARSRRASASNPAAPLNLKR
ncbi:VanZ family protein [Salinibacterium sp. NK8237]|uniref:VanZ family protein n=1 Tax=Salinibacterium sp. NK8237 TaxID=2792038 RepID=UPI0018CCB071|nr:VanZ family protein [Salinibacterium sp. NK8237]MBH0129399.1 VanZ family protein [Salinibacterium sp. NK8237]